MIHDVASQVSFISRYVTLFPGDLIFTGTSGKTAALHAGDVVEVEPEGVGVLRNRVVAQNRHTGLWLVLHPTLTLGWG
ncbi:MAG: fumarylacetoacetate hydrolase family protein [Pirellulaceae bacterium]